MTPTMNEFAEKFAREFEEFCKDVGVDDVCPATAELKNYARKVWNAAVQAERERCAGIARETGALHAACTTTAGFIAAAIEKEDG